MKSRQIVSAALLAGGMAFSSGACGDATPRSAPDVYLDAKDITVVQPGSTFVEAVTDASVRKSLTQSLTLTDNERPNGFEDKAAPTISETPIRIVARVALKGQLPLSHSANDVSCDTLNVDLSGLQDKKAARIGVVALSDDASDKVQINWTQDANGQPANSLQVCVVDNKEPVNGVVLVLTRTSPALS